MFSALFAALPGLKAALLRPLEPAVAVEYPDWAIRSLALLESGVRWGAECLLVIATHPHICHQGHSALCFNAPCHVHCKLTPSCAVLGL